MFHRQESATENSRKFRTDADNGRKYRQSTNSLLAILGIRRQRRNNTAPNLVSPMFMM